MPKLLTQGVSSEPETGRSLIGIVAGFRSESATSCFNWRKLAAQGAFTATASQEWRAQRLRSGQDQLRRVQQGRRPSGRKVGSQITEKSESPSDRGPCRMHTPRPRARIEA
ncbi:hypothetical protein D9M68_431270 [compost metagenome]